MYKSEMNGIVIFFALGLLAKTYAVPLYQNATDPVDCTKINTTTVTFPNPSDCNKYFHCENGTKIEMVCPLGQQYNAHLKTCDDPKYAGCKINASFISTERNGAENFTLANVKSEVTSNLENKNETANLTNKESLTITPKSQESEVNTNITANSLEVLKNDTSNFNETLENLTENNSTSNIHGNSSTANITESTSNITSGTKTVPEILTERITSSPFTSNTSTISYNSSISKILEVGNVSKTSEDTTTENLFQDTTKSTPIGRASFDKVNITNDKNIKIVDHRNDQHAETEEKDDETENEDEEEKRNEKQTILAKQH